MFCTNYTHVLKTVTGFLIFMVVEGTTLFLSLEKTINSRFDRWGKVNVKKRDGVKVRR